MKKEDLIALGLSEEQAKSVMTEHGKTVTTLNAQISTLQASEKELQSQAAKHAEDLKVLQKNAGTSEELKQQIKQLQKENSDKEQQYQQELIDIQRNSALNQVLTESKVKNVKAVAALLDNDAITFKDGQLIGAKEQLESLVKTDAYLFDLGTKPGSYNPAGGESVTTLSFEEAMEKGDLDSYLKQKIESEEQE